MKRIVFAALFLTGCGDFVPIDQANLPAPSSSQKPPTYLTLPGPDPGGGLPFTSLHFVVEGYGTVPQDKAQTVEKIFSEITDETGLYSFKPEENYRVVIYQTQEEFLRKTGQPQWSGGMKTGRGVFTYEQDNVDATLAHEITHIIFGDLLGQEEHKHRWLNEGLAVYIEAHFDRWKRFDDVQAEWHERIHSAPLLTMDAILDFKPYSEKDREVGIWYATVADLTAFLIQNGGNLNFSLFLKALAAGFTPDQALVQAYPGKYASLNELYAVWKGTL